MRPDKGNSCNRGLNNCKAMSLSTDNSRHLVDLSLPCMNVFHPRFRQDLTLNINARIEVQSGAYDDAENYLSKHFKPASQTITIRLLIIDSLFLSYSLGPQFQVIVNKTNDAQPGGA